MDVTIDEIIENFDFLGDWEEKYMYLIHLGRKLPEFDPNLKRPELLVEGCTSKVWLVKEVIRNGSTTINFNADSESTIVKGLVALLVIIYSGKSPEEISELDVQSYFNKLELEQHLSGNRANGLRSMVKRIKTEAANL
jgi:cysteine desulfuration protein SufE